MATYLAAPSSGSAENKARRSSKAFWVSSHCESAGDKVGMHLTEQSEQSARIIVQLRLRLYLVPVSLNKKARPIVRRLPAWLLGELQLRSTQSSGRFEFVHEH